MVHERCFFRFGLHLCIHASMHSCIRQILRCVKWRWKIRIKPVALLEMFGSFFGPRPNLSSSGTPLKSSSGTAPRSTSPPRPGSSAAQAAAAAPAAAAAQADQAAALAAFTAAGATPNAGPPLTKASAKGAVLAAFNRGTMNLRKAYKDTGANNAPVNGDATLEAAKILRARVSAIPNNAAPPLAAAEVPANANAKQRANANAQQRANANAAQKRANADAKLARLNAATGAFFTSVEGCIEPITNLTPDPAAQTAVRNALANVTTQLEQLNAVIDEIKASAPKGGPLLPLPSPSRPLPPAEVAANAANAAKAAGATPAIANAAGQAAAAAAASGAPSGEIVLAAQATGAPLVVAQAAAAAAAAELPDMPSDAIINMPQLPQDIQRRLLKVNFPMGGPVTPAALKSWYKISALKSHPNKNPNANAKERFHEINELYQLLTELLEKSKKEPQGRLLGNAAPAPPAQLVNAARDPQGRPLVNAPKPANALPPLPAKTALEALAIALPEDTKVAYQKLDGKQLPYKYVKDTGVYKIQNKTDGSNYKNQQTTPITIPKGSALFGVLLDDVFFNPSQLTYSNDSVLELNVPGSNSGKEIKIFFTSPGATLEKVDTLSAQAAAALPKKGGKRKSKKATRKARKSKKTTRRR